MNCFNSFAVTDSYISNLSFALHCVLRLRLSIMLSTICLFGTEMHVLSRVLILVLRKPIFSTIPVKWCTLTVSPVANGLSKKMMKEAIKFSRLSLVANAIAAPTMLKPVRRLPMFRLNANRSSNSTPVITTSTLKKSLKNTMSWLSNWS